MAIRRSSSAQFGIDAPDLGAALSNDIIQAIIPKEQRKQAQRQHALEVLAQIAPRIAEFAPEEKKKFYNQYFFPAYGMYQPPLFRKLFGAQAEPVLPLPEGATETSIPMERNFLPFGLAKKRFTQKDISLPKQEPMKFARPPFIQPEEEEELKRQAASLYPDSPEDQQTWLSTQKTALISKIKPSKEDLTWEAINRAERLVDSYKQNHPEATDEEAITALPSNVRRRYQEHLNKVAADKAYREELTEDVAARIRLAEQREKDLQQAREDRLEYQRERDLTRKEREAAINIASVKPLREALLRMYLSGDVWPNEESKTKAIQSAQAGLWDDVYFQLNEPQRKTFDQLIGAAQPYVRTKGIVESLNQALRDLQKTRPAAFQPTGGGPPPSVGAAPPKTREKPKGVSTPSGKTYMIEEVG